jgi:hypothetical protein
MTRRVWLPRLLFWLVCGLAGGLVVLVLLAPLLEGRLTTGGRVLYLFAHDATLRRTSLSSALGLVVTAYVFFQAPPAKDQPVRRRPPRSSGAGA